LAITSLVRSNGLFLNHRRITIATKNDSTVLSVVHPVCCGLDVHKKKISACLLQTGVVTDEIPGISELLAQYVSSELDQEPGEEYLSQRNNANKLIKFRREAKALGYKLVELTAT
jgi:hypothetical protein